MKNKQRVILVTDGDMSAKEAVEAATEKIGGRCISSSAGNPTMLSAEEIIERIKEASHDPVVVMVDDRGAKGQGKGESAMAQILGSKDIDVIGVVAVSSNGKDCVKHNMDCYINRDCDVIHSAVNKQGYNTHKNKICGDTLSVLKHKNNLFIVGIGDPGKMDYRDEAFKDSPVTTKALQIIMEHAEQN